MAEGNFTPGERIPWPALRAIAARRFGIRRFRPGQRELLEAVLSDKDAIGILPTGAGKSLGELSAITPVLYGAASITKA